MEVNVWSDVQSTSRARGRGADDQPITKANPGVVGYTGTDPSNGDMLLIVKGMADADYLVARVANCRRHRQHLPARGHRLDQLERHVLSRARPTS
jgi:hypothetical protein